MQKTALISLVLWTAALSAGWADTEPPFVFDPRTGVIDGKIAMTILPSHQTDAGKPRPVEPADFVVHLESIKDKGTQFTFPSGTWYAPPSGAYRFWLEGDGQMSRYSAKMFYRGGPFRGRGAVAGIPVVPAGSVRLGDGAPRSPRITLRLLHAGSYLEGAAPKLELSRRITTAELGNAGIQMPEGPTLATLYDTKSRKYVAMSRPFLVRAGLEVEAPLETPGEQSFILAHLKRPDFAEDASDNDIQVWLERASSTKPGETVTLFPEMVVSTAQRLYIAWFDLEPGPVQLKASSSKLTLRATHLELETGEISRIDVDLQKKPSLDLEVVVPAPLEAESLTLELWQGDTKLENVHLVHGLRSLHFVGVPPEMLGVVLVTPHGDYLKWVDMSSGENQFVVLEPSFIVLEGTVTIDGELRPSKLTFTTVARYSLEVRAAENGRYEVIAVQPVRTVSIETEDLPGEPYFDFFSPPITESEEIDFVIPAPKVSVRVLDEMTGQPIKRASVSVRNEHAKRDGFTRRSTEVEEGEDEEQRPAEPTQERSVNQTATTNEEGIATLAPVRPGRLKIWAAADEYAPLPEPMEVVIGQDDEERQIDLFLRPFGEWTTLTIALPDGRPAAQAYVALVADLTVGRERFTALTNQDGRVELPENLGGSILLVRHPQAAFHIGHWNVSSFEAERPYVQLFARAPVPLVVHTLDPFGREPAPRAEIAIWVNGQRLAGHTLFFLTGERPISDALGQWRASNLPPGEIAVLAWDLSARNDAQSGALDSQAQVTRLPAGDPIEVRVFR